MQGLVGSPTFTVERLGHDLYLECGSRRWTLLDFFDLSLLSGPRSPVFYLRAVDSQ